jgi:hypothetical protein
VQQCGKTVLESLELSAIIAQDHPSWRFFPIHKPVIQTRHNMRYPAAFRVNAPRSEGGNELADADLLVSHGEGLLKFFLAN